MSLDTAIQRWRTRQAALIRGTGTLRRPDPSAVIDLGSGLWDPPPADVYSGPGNVRPAERLGSNVQANEQTVRVGNWVGVFPAGTDTQVNDEWTQETSEFDEGLVDKTFRVMDVLWDDWQVGRYVSLELVSALAEAETGS